YDYILVNDRLDESTENLKSILIAERLKRSGQRVADDSVRRRAESCRLDNVRERLKPILASFASACSWRLIVVSFFQKLRQWLSGAPPGIETHSRKPCGIAQDEIKAGKVKWVIPEIPKSAAEAASEMLDKALGPE